MRRWTCGIRNAGISRDARNRLVGENFDRWALRHSRLSPLRLPKNFAALCEQLEELAPGLSDVDDWPGHQLQPVAAAGLLGWGLPDEFGGHPVSDSEMLAAYEMMAAACLTTTFVLTQRNAACQRITSSDNQEIKSELLPPALR